MFSTPQLHDHRDPEQCEAAYRDAQTHNLAAGWWSFLSILLTNWIAIFGNMGQINQIRRLAAQPPVYQAYSPVGYPPAAIPPISTDVLIRSQCPARPILRTVRASRPTPAAGPGKG
ncbi:transmembrane protein [Mycobacteroides abscessus subsp. bolletii]|nr:transmembrane protein [Mycobacteroides abscessus subsp. bolletii]SHX64314.1 transmembrane protein [Mycobacteroides abscessus subsp. bolletii]SHX75415.1 transmembrane protein [Mycobacteroides abscessus subsp. bolletii]SHY04859.1 transmembrane protein [Mycobacteroides abscessus subsp. bolletii]SKS27624.1 transmembrane protein [Mycobacteroides abscessus subsp. bolletii]